MKYEGVSFELQVAPFGLNILQSNAFSSRIIVVEQAERSSTETLILVRVP